MMVGSFKFVLEFSLRSGFDPWRHELSYIALPVSGFWSVNYTLVK